MINTQLSLEISSDSNEKVMRIFDTSFYYKDEIVENYIVEVLPANKTRWVPFNVNKGFFVVLNSSNLQYRKANTSDELVSLIDGIYEFKQSVKPNINNINHFYHFRIIHIINKISHQRDKLYDNKCNLSRHEFIINRDKLRDIEEYVYGAKWKVEECLDKHKGIEMYEFANLELQKYTNECQC